MNSDSTARRTRAFAPLCATLILAACGGGGGDGGNDGTPPPPSPPPPPPPAATYTVGGTVTGLQGTGLVLRNGGVDLPVSASGSFRFAAGLNTGASYDVTVTTQPANPAQICTVSQGQGQIQAANIDNVQVECRTTFEFVSSVPTDGSREITRSVRPALTFSAPLAPASLTTGLATLTSIAGPETVQLSASGSVLTVTPSRPLLPLTDYTLTVANSLLSDAGATLADPVSFSFRTREGAWGSQLALTGTDVVTGGLNPIQTRVVADPEGRVTVGWLNERGSLFKKEVWARHRALDGTWGEAVRLDDSDLDDVGDLVLAGDASGTVFAVWPQSDGGLAGDFNRLMYRVFTTSGGWQPVQQLTQLTGDLSQLNLSVHPDGSAQLVWYQGAPGMNAILASRYVPGSGWTAPQRLDAAPSTVQSPKVTVSDGGVAIAAWTQVNSSSSSDVFASRFDPTTGWGTPVRVSANVLSGFASAMTLAGRSNGDAVVAWRFKLGTTEYISSSFFTPALGWSPQVRVEAGAGASDIPQVRLDDLGVAHAVWRQAISGALHIHASRRDPLTGNWSTPVPVSSSNIDSGAFEPVLTVDRRGNVLVAWYQLTVPTDYQVFGNRYTPDSGWGGAEPIGDIDRPVQPFSVGLATDGAGTVWAAWVQQDSNRVPRVLVNSYE